MRRKNRRTTCFCSGEFLGLATSVHHPTRIQNISDPHILNQVLVLDNKHRLRNPPLITPQKHSRRAPIPQIPLSLPPQTPQLPNLLTQINHPSRLTLLRPLSLDPIPPNPKLQHPVPEPPVHPTHKSLLADLPLRPQVVMPVLRRRGVTSNGAELGLAVEDHCGAHAQYISVGGGGGGGGGEWALGG